jgi:hypothetical protein
MSAGRIALIVVGSILALIGLAVAAGGGVILWAHGTQRDADGFFTTSTERFRTTTFALTSDRVDLGSEGDHWAADLGDLARVRVRAASALAGRPVFVGIGPARAVQAYLAGVPHEEVAEVDFDPFRVRYRARPGAVAPAPPAGRVPWAAQAAGTGTQTLEWRLEPGTWTLVVMNRDAARGVVADVSLGVAVAHLLAIGIGVLVGGLVLLGSGVTMIVFGSRDRAAGAAPAAGPHPPAAPRVPVCPSCGQPASAGLADAGGGWECGNEACTEFGQPIRADEP